MLTFGFDSGASFGCCIGIRFHDLEFGLLSSRPGAKDARIGGRRIFRHPFPLFQHLPESLLLPVVVQDGLLRHSGQLAPLVPTQFAFFPVLDGDLAAAVLLADKLRHLGVEVRPSPERAAAEAGHAAVVADELLQMVEIFGCDWDFKKSSSTWGYEDCSSAFCLYARDPAVDQS